MQVTVKTDLPILQDALERAAKQVPFALSTAINHTAAAVKDEQRKTIGQVFDRPTRFTLNAVFMRPSTKQTLEAEVWLRGDGSRDGGSGRHYLLPQIEGGSRPLKKFEHRLVSAGYLRKDERTVPGDGATLDSFGNMSRGQIVKILSQLKTSVSGSDSAATGSKRSKAKRAKEGYFFAGGRETLGVSGGTRATTVTGSAGKTAHLARGIWIRRSFGAWGTAIKPVLLFVKRTNYRKRFDFFTIGQRVTDARFEPNFNRAFEQAMETARLPK